MTIIRLKNGEKVMKHVTFINEIPTTILEDFVEKTSFRLGFESSLSYEFVTDSKEQKEAIENEIKEIQNRTNLLVEEITRIQYEKKLLIDELSFLDMEIRYPSGVYKS